MSPTTASPLKKIIQELVDQGKVKKVQQPNFINNPLTGSAGTQKKFDDIGMSTGEAFDKLVSEGLMSPKVNYVSKPNADMTRYCRFHQGHGHDTDHCFSLKRGIQKLIDERRIPKANS